MTRYHKIECFFRIPRATFPQNYLKIGSFVVILLTGKKTDKLVNSRPTKKTTFLSKVIKSKLVQTLFYLFDNDKRRMLSSWCSFAVHRSDCHRQIDSREMNQYSSFYTIFTYTRWKNRCIGASIPAGYTCWIQQLLFITIDVKNMDLRIKNIKNMFLSHNKKHGKNIKKLFPRRLCHSKVIDVCGCSDVPGCTQVLNKITHTLSSCRA